MSKDNIRGRGKGGMPAAFKLGDNTLKANVVVSTIEALGEGPILGLARGNESIFLNATPIQNPSTGLGATYVLDGQHAAGSTTIRVTTVGTGHIGAGDSVQIAGATYVAQSGLSGGSFVVAAPGLASIVTSGSAVTLATTGTRGSFNFDGKVQAELRTGGPDNQVPVPGFDLVGTPGVGPNQSITKGGVPSGTPAVSPVYSVDEDGVVAVDATVSLPQGLSNNDADDKQVKSTVVSVRFETKLAGEGEGQWAAGSPIEFNGKTMSEYQETFRVYRPGHWSSGAWQVRAVRLTDDEAENSNVKNATRWAYTIELQKPEPPLTYPGVAYLAMEVDAHSVNSNSIPTRSAIINGLVVEIPSNMDEFNRTFDGEWDGLFKYGWTNDPAWVVYAMATNRVWGLGLDPADVDRYSFYDASVYNAGLLESVGRTGEPQRTPRFSFNYNIRDGQVATELMNKVASTMHAKIMWVGGQLTLLQDRPRSLAGAQIFNRANVIGSFEYVGTPKQSRHTVCNVTWNSPAQRYEPRVSSVPQGADDAVWKEAGLDKYEYNAVQVAAFGCTSETQARYWGRHYLDTVLFQTDQISFKTGLAGSEVLPMAVVEVHDNNYDTPASGRLAAGSTTTLVKLDRSVSFSALSQGGTLLLDIELPDGTVLSGLPVQENVGWQTELNLVDALAAAPPQYSLFVLRQTGAVPKYYQVESVREEERGVYTVKANAYDPGKWERVEGTAMNLASVTVAEPISTQVAAPSNLAFAERFTFAEGRQVRTLVVSWTRSASALVSGYRLAHRFNGGSWAVLSLPTTSHEIAGVEPGLVEVQVKAVSAAGTSSALVGEYSVLALPASAGPSPLGPVEDLGVYPGGGTSWNTPSLTVSWLNPESNGAVGGLKDFEVSLLEPLPSTTVVRTEYAQGVAAGETQTYTYSFEQNSLDGAGAPRRSLRVRVKCRDVAHAVSAAAEALFSNPAPPALANFAVTPGIGTLMLTWDRPADPDVAGVMVWRDAAPGFAPSAENLVADETGTMLVENGLPALTAQTYRAAAYDTFSRPVDGAGLNVVSGTGSPLGNAGIPSGASNPGTGTEGDLFFNSTDGQLYRYHSGGWTAAVPAVNVQGLLTNAQLDTSKNKLRNSSFEGRQATAANRPTYYVQYNNAGISVEYTVPAGRLGGTGYGLKALASTGVTQFGLHTHTPENPDGFGVVGGWQPNTSYVVSWYAKKVGGAGWTGMSHEWNVWPASHAVLLNPNLTTSYQRYAFRITMGGSVEGAGRLYISVMMGSTAANDEIHIDDIQVEEGTTLTGYTPRLDEIVSVQAINVTGQLADAQLASIATTKLTGTVADAQIAGMAAAKLGGQITSTQITDSAVTTAKVNARAIDAGKIAVGGILAENIASGAVTTGKLLVTGQGRALNDDPGCVDASAWFAGQGSFAVQADTTVPVGTNSLRLTGSGTGMQLQTAKFLPVEAGKQYKVSLYVKTVSGAGLLYIRLYCYNAAGAEVNSFVYDAVTGALYEGLGQSPGGWVRFNGVITPGPTAVKAKIILHTNWNSGGVTDVTDVRCEEYVGADLIVDGAISANKIAANAITSNHIAANTITAADIAGGTITATQIASGTITATQIAGSTITAAQIASGTITATQIAGDTITANQIAANAITSSELAANSVIAGKILASSVSTNELASNSVTADKMVANTITAASGIIADAAIGTLKIAGNAVTVPVYAELGSTVSCGFGETKNVLSLTIDTGGQPVYVTYALHSFLFIHPNDGLGQSAIIRVYVNGVLKATHSLNNYSQYYMENIELFSVYAAAPGSGTFTVLITLQNARPTNNSEGYVSLNAVTANYPATSIFAIGVKR